MSVIDSSKTNEILGLPPELVHIGSDGGEGMYALWLAPGANPDEAPVLLVDMGSQQMAIVATSYARFLTAETAITAVVWEDQQALSKLGVPEDLLSDERDDEIDNRLRRFFDPALPDPGPDPFARPADELLLRQQFGSR